MSTTTKIMNAFLKGQSLKYKHIKTNGNNITIDDVKVCYKASHSKGINIKVNFTKECPIKTYNTILSYINNQWKLTNKNGERVLIGQTGITSNPVNDSTVGFMMFNKSGQQFFNRTFIIE